MPFQITPVSPRTGMVAFARAGLSVSCFIFLPSLLNARIDQPIFAPDHSKPFFEKNGASLS